MGCVGVHRERRAKLDQMDDDFVDVFRGGVGDSPVKTSCAPDHDLGSTSSWRSGPPISLSIPGIETGGGAAPVSPAIPSHGIAMPSPPAKEGVLFSARTFTNLRDDDYASQHTGQLQLSPVSSPHPRFGLTPILTIDPGGECIPTELEKKRAKLERYRYICSEVRIILGGRLGCTRTWVKRSYGCGFLESAGITVHTTFFSCNHRHHAVSQTYTPVSCATET